MLTRKGNDMKESPYNVVCPTCHAKRGERCFIERTSGGYTKYRSDSAHATRIETADGLTKAFTVLEDLPDDIG